ncbi:response regulator [Bacillota bacterium LX-D]|nr:response regulator [Bacillota bacterium LX-D]
MAQHHILVVDDQKGVRQLLKLFLQEEGYVITTASNGREAVEITQQEKPDLVIMDVKMPVMDGDEALANIREINPNLPVIMMTAYTDAQKMKELFKLGAVECFFKPIDLEHLLAKAGEILN